MKDYKYNIYLDNAATTKPFPEVVALYNETVNALFANPSSSHHLGIEANSKLEKAKESILKELSLKDYSLIWTSGATEGLNLILKGYAHKFRNRGNRIISSSVEHPAVKETLKSLEREGFEVIYLPVNKDGVINLKDLKENIDDKTIIVSIMAMNNEVGSVSEIKAIKEIVKDYPKCIFVSDTTQAIAKEDIPYGDIDAFVISAHKIHGLKNSGALIYRKNISFDPLICGGGQQGGLRSGTMSVSDALCLEEALSISLKEKKEKNSHVLEMNKYLRNELSKIDGIAINSPETASNYILNYSTKKKAAVLVESLSMKGIFISSVSACHSKFEASSYVVNEMFHDAVRAKNTLRVSLDSSNTMEECEIFIRELKDSLENIR